MERKCVAANRSCAAARRRTPCRALGSDRICKVSRASVTERDTTRATVRDVLAQIDRAGGLAPAHLRQVLADARGLAALELRLTRLSIGEERRQLLPQLGRGIGELVLRQLVQQVDMGFVGETVLSKHRRLAGIEVGVRQIESTRAKRGEEGAIARA